MHLKCVYILDLKVYVTVDKTLLASVFPVGVHHYQKGFLLHLTMRSIG